VPRSRDSSDTTTTPETQGDDVGDRGEDQAEKKDDPDDFHHHMPQHEPSSKQPPFSETFSRPLPPQESSPVRSTMKRISLSSDDTARTSNPLLKQEQRSSSKRLLPNEQRFKSDEDHAWDEDSFAGDDNDDDDDGDCRIRERNNDDDNHDDNPDTTDDDPKDDDDDKRNQSRLWRSRLLVGRLVNHEYVQITIISLILINAVMMGFGTMDWVTENPKVNNVFDKIDRGFLVIFTLEVSMQLYYLGISLFQDGWLIFDLSIVVFSWSFESLQIVRAFRIFRAFRLITRVKPLRDLVLAIGAVIPRMYAIAALLMIIFYVFAVLFTELFSELPLSENYFRTLDASLFTCMQMMTLEWADVAREVIEYESWAWAPFSFFIAISGFIVYNLIVAVVVEAVAVTEQTVRAMDGMDSNSPTAKLEEAEERIDLIRYHIEDMMRTQDQIQTMLETMAGEMLHLETERMKAEEREAMLRNEISRRMQYQKSPGSKSQKSSLERKFAEERQRRESERQQRQQVQRENSKELLSSLDGASVEDMQRSLHEEHLSSRHPKRMVRRGSTGGSAASKSSSRPGSRAATATGSNRSLNSRSISSRSVGSSGDENGSKEKGWKRFLAFQAHD
jgi:hypothetical protein